MGLGIPRLLGVGGVGLAVLAIIGIVALRGGSQPMTLLYSDMELRDSAQVAAALDKLHVPYEVREGGVRLLVPADQVDRLRLALARDGLPAGGSVGYEVFDRGDSLTANQFQQQMNQLRALEGEIGRTIRTIRGVRNSRVHLVLGKREPFAREPQEAQASIVLAMTGSQRMSDEEVQAIVNLVSSAVPGLKAQNVSVVDSRGTLLARAGRGSATDRMSGSNEDVRRAMELRLGQAVEDMLSRTLGPGHVRAEATVEMDFDRVNETLERFDPDGQVVHNHQSVTDTNKNTEQAATVSVQNNLPNPEPQAGGNGSASSRQEENTTFENSKSIRTRVRDTPSIKRISMAVLVDGITAKATDGKPTWRELSQTDLDRIGMLVKSAVGYDEKRGDRVEVVNMRFSAPEDIGDVETTAAPWLQFGKVDMTWLITIGVVSLVALFALIFVLRPLALRILAAELAKPPSQLALSGSAQTGPLTVSASSGPTQLSTQLGAIAPTNTTDNDTMLNIENIQGQVRAASIHQLGQLVENHPEASVTIIRNWLTQKETA